MNKLNELIQKLCPDGVEYKKLGEIATISRGGNFQKKDIVLPLLMSEERLLLALAVFPKRILEIWRMFWMDIQSLMV